MTKSPRSGTQSIERALHVLRELATRVWAIEGDKIADFGGTFVEWEQMKKDQALKRRADEALAADARREKERERSKANAAAERESQAERKSKKQDAARAEKAVQFLTDPTWRAYITCYVEGVQVCRRYVDGDPARFARLVTEQLTPTELAAV